MIRAAETINYPILLVSKPRLFGASLRLTLKGWRENLFQTDFSALQIRFHNQ